VVKGEQEGATIAMGMIWIYDEKNHGRNGICRRFEHRIGRGWLVAIHMNI
jgi:hypothetical protein